MPGCNTVWAQPPSQESTTTSPPPHRARTHVGGKLCVRDGVVRLAALPHRLNGGLPLCDACALVDVVATAGGGVHGLQPTGGQRCRGVWCEGQRGGSGGGLSGCGSLRGGLPARGGEVRGSVWARCTRRGTKGVRTRLGTRWPATHSSAGYSQLVTPDSVFA